MKSLKHTRKAACRISAAALMLGVSHGATIGFNFTANYCAASSYSGAYVTGTAFGIATNDWESLSQMDTGYGCTSGVGPYTLNEVIDTAPAAGGLNPLPNGSLNVTWSAYESNVSGFGGYEAPPPHYTFGGNGYSPGNEQVYWGFLRDGVNFGSGENDGDNDQEGWSVDITGLKSVFTNSSFVVETIGAGDSIQNLTNVFIIDATLSTTQSVTYPNIPPVANQGEGSGTTLGTRHWRRPEYRQRRGEYRPFEDHRKSRAALERTAGLQQRERGGRVHSYGQTRDHDVATAARGGESRRSSDTEGDCHRSPAAFIAMAE